MRMGWLAAVAALGVACGAAQALPPSAYEMYDRQLDEARFREAWEHAMQLVRLGRKLEGRAHLGNLAWRLKRYNPLIQYKHAKALIAALTDLRDFESVDLVEQTLVDTCVGETTHSRSSVEDLPKVPRARGLELARLALTLEESSPQRAVLMRGALAALGRVIAPDAEVQHRLGLCHLEVGNKLIASRLLLAAVEADPKSPGPRIALARLHLASGLAEAALGMLEIGLERELSREGVRLLTSVLVALDGQGKGDAARAGAARWTGKSTEGGVMAPLWALEGQLAENDKNLKAALTAYAKAVGGDPLPATLAGVGRVARALADVSAAERHAVVAELARVTRADAGTPPALLRLTGELALRDGDAALAIKLYGAGWAGSKRHEFEPLLSELRQSFRLAKKHDLAALVDAVFGPPKSPEFDKEYVVVEMGRETCTIDVATGRLGAAPRKPEHASFAATIATAFRAYPPDLLKKLRLWKFVLTESPVVAGSRWMGLTDPEQSTIHVNVKTAVTRPEDWQLMLHHELFHLIDFQDDGRLSTDPKWTKLNRAGWLYTYNKNVPCDPITSSTGMEVAGFVNAYATTGLEEDKATTFANMMVYFGAVEGRCGRDPIVMAKAERIRKICATFSPALDDAWWDGVKGRCAAAAGANVSASAAGADGEN